MNLPLESKIALVTGASKGVGKGIALELARAGAQVIVNYNSDSAGADATIAEIRGMGGNGFAVQADVSLRAAVDRMLQSTLERFNRLDILVNNAGVQTWKPLLDLEEAEWDRTIQTNLKGCFLVHPARRPAHEGARVRENHQHRFRAATRSPFPNLVDYTASKGGIEMLTKVSAIELGKYRITVNCVAPGAIEIERTKLETGDYAGTWAKLTPLGRVGQPARYRAHGGVPGKRGRRIHHRPNNLGGWRTLHSPDLAISVVSTSIRGGRWWSGIPAES